MNKRSRVIIFSVLLGALFVLFGGYILYEKAYLAVLEGHSHERAGLIERAESPFSFWLGFAVYGLCASAIVLAGVALLIRVLRRR